MRCKLIILTFAISIVPAVANAALTTTIDIGKITCSQYLAMRLHCQASSLLGERLV